MQLQVGVAITVADVELDDVQRTLEAVLLEALLALRRDGRYADLRHGPVVVRRRAA